MSVPAQTPAEVTYFPASTQRETLSHKTRGPNDVTHANAAWFVAAGFPSNKPESANTAAPVQTDVVILTRWSIFFTQSIRAFTSSACPCTSGPVFPPGIMNRSKDCFRASSRNISVATRGPFSLFTGAGLAFDFPGGLTSFEMNRTSKGYGGGGGFSP